MTAILGRTGNLVGFSTGRGTTPWDTEMEAALRKMDAMLASTVVAITNTLPGSANEGDLYLVGTLPTGVAAGWANRIARWRGSPAGWEAYQPMQGWIITIVGESTNKVRRYDGTAWVAIATDAGAEPAIIDGTAAQYWSGLKLWTDFATSVRATVLTGLSLASSAVVAATDSVLVAIGKLQAQVSSKLPSDNPAFTGTLTGGSAALTEFGTLRDYVGNPAVGALYAAGVTPDTDNYVLAMTDAGTETYLGASDKVVLVVGGTSKLTVDADKVVLVVGGTSKLTVDADEANLASGVALKMAGATVIDSSRNITGTTLKGGNLPGAGDRPVAADITGTLQPKTPDQARSLIGAAKAPAKADISASTTIGSIDATAIKVTTTDVNLTLSGGVNGQGWDIVCPTTSFGISIPTGVTLYAYAGSDIGPTTRAVGGGRGIRIVRIDAATWIAPNLTW